jgi:O-antigen/teichoic acid export membrane protein
MSSWFRKRLSTSSRVLAVLENMSWMFADRVVRMCVGVVLGIWLARYLGVSDFGVLNYATAFVSLFGVFAAFGINAVLVRNIVLEPEKRLLFLGTAFALQAVTTLLASLALIVLARIMNADEPSTRSAVSVAGLALCFQGSGVVKSWFESQVQARYTVCVEGVAFLLGATARVVMLLSEAPLIAFVWIAVIEAGVSATALFVTYQILTRGLGKWRTSLSCAGSMLRAAWPLALANMAIMVYIRIDQVMLGQVAGKEDVGIFSAAVRASEVWYAIPMVIVASVFPSILQSKASSEKIYTMRVQSLLDIVATLALFIAVVTTLTADWIIAVLYGDAFQGAVPVLRVHIWACIFVFIGVVGGNWYIAEDLQKYFLKCTVLGASVNVLLNWLLIPKYGVSGSAAATVLSQALASYALDMQSRRTRVLFALKSNALVFGPVRIASRFYAQVICP